jgi:hypothetical protein
MHVIHHDLSPTLPLEGREALYRPILHGYLLKLHFQNFSNELPWNLWQSVSLPFKGRAGEGSLKLIIIYLVTSILRSI